MTTTARRPMIDTAEIPQTLRERSQWVLWRTVTRGDKPTKVPCQTSGAPAKSSDSTTWSTYANVLARYERGGYCGIGYVFSSDDPYCGVDLDGCRDPQTGEIATWAQTIISRVGTYAEVSPSGTGVKLFARGRWPLPRGKKKIIGKADDGGKAPAIECYDRGRYFAVTGWRLPDSPAEPRDAQNAIDWLVATYWPVADGYTSRATRCSGRLQGRAPAGDTIDFARRRLEKIGPAVSGQDGHGTTYRAACELFRCRLSMEQAREQLAEYNATCQPPWSDWEIEHKLADAQAEVEREAKYYDPPAQRDHAGRNGRAKPASKIEICQSAPLTDLGNAERLVARHGADLRYCHPWRKWLAWDGRRWRLDDTAEVDRRAQETVRSIDDDVARSADADYRKALRAWATKCEDASRLGAMMQLARSQPGIPILPADLDSDPWLLNVANGTVELRTGRLREHRREDYLTKVCPAEYLAPAEAESPQWSRFLADVFLGDEAVIAFVQRLLGYCVSGIVREHVLPICWGVGANGKSTLLETIIAVMGHDYACKAADELLTEKRGDRHPTERADLHGRRLVVTSETDGGRRLAEATVKRLTGDGRIKARRMKQDFWEFEPTHKLILVTNHKPIVRGRDLGIWRRLLLVPFAATFEGAACDPSMPQKLLYERDGILRWLVDGCLDWQRDGLNPPEVVKVATAEYRASQDTLAQFFDERCERHPDWIVKASDLFRAYKAWSEARDEGSMSMTAFGHAMAEAGIEKEPKKRRNGWHYMGIGIVGEGEA